MKSLKLEINPYKKTNTISINGQAISNYSEFNNYIRVPFLLWADKLPDLAKNEINDYYKLVVVGDEFEKRFISTMYEDINLAKEFATEEFVLNYSVDSRLKYLLDLCEKYKITKPQLDNYKVKVYNEARVNIDENYFSNATLEEASIIILDDIQRTYDLSFNDNNTIILVISNESKIRAIGIKKYIWEIRNSELEEILNLVVNRFIKIPMIINLSNELINSHESLFEKNEFIKLKLATEVDLYITVDDVNSLEVGDRVDLKIKTIPPTDKIPDIKIISSNPNVLAVGNNSLKAISKGEVYIDIYKALEIVPFDRKKVKVLTNNYVKQINLKVDNHKMGIGYSQKLKVDLFPTTAEDISKIKFSSSNPQIANIDNNGNIVANMEGRVTLTAYTPRAQNSIELKVLPNISNILFKEKSLDIYVGETKEVLVDMEEKEYFDDTLFWNSSDENIVTIEEVKDNIAKISAKSIGRCRLECVAKEGGKSATCNINVENTFKKYEEEEQIHKIKMAVGFIVLIAIYIICSY